MNYRFLEFSPVNLLTFTKGDFYDRDCFPINSSRFSDFTWNSDAVPCNLQYEICGIIRMRNIIFENILRTFCFSS